MDKSAIRAWPKWAHSPAGRPSALYASGQNTTTQLRPILIIGGVHGDEPEGVWLAEHCLDWLKSVHVSIPWFVIPCLNPDGFGKNERTNSRGVDLNRNLPSQSWSVKYEKPRYNPGPEPASEPEVRALVHLIDRENPQLIIHCHSWKPCVVYTGDPAQRDSERLAKASGYEAKSDIGYPTPGSLGEYGWREKNIPVICIEEAERVPRASVWPRFKKGFEDIFSDISPRI